MHNGIWPTTGRELRPDVRPKVLLALPEAIDGLTMQLTRALEDEHGYQVTQASTLETVTPIFSSLPATAYLIIGGYFTPDDIKDWYAYASQLNWTKNEASRTFSIEACEAMQRILGREAEDATGVIGCRTYGIVPMGFRPRRTLVVDPKVSPIPRELWQDYRTVVEAYTGIPPLVLSRDLSELDAIVQLIGGWEAPQPEQSHSVLN